MSDDLFGLCDEVDKYFGGGPLAGLLPDPEDDKKRTGVAGRMQFSQRRTEENSGLGLSKRKQTSRSQGKKSKLPAGPHASSRVVVAWTGTRAPAASTQSTGIQGAVAGNSRGLRNTVGMAGSRTSGAIAPSRVVLAATGLKAQFMKTQSSGFQGATVGSSLGSGNGVGMAGGTFSGAMALYTRFQDEEDGKHSRGGGGVSGASPLVGGRSKTTRPAPTRSAKSDAARAAIASGAQPAVFKVISSVSSTGSAKALMEYLGRREGEDGQKHDIEVEVEDGRKLTSSAERQTYLEDFAANFSDPYTNTNFVELELTVTGALTDDQLQTGLTQAFGHKPFVYTRSADKVRVFGNSDDKATTLNKGLKERKAGSPAKALRNYEVRLEAKLQQSGIKATVSLTGATGTERATKYYLQKFMRSNPALTDEAGQKVRIAKRVDKSADRVFESWRGQLKTREVRNAFHLLFSARAVTPADAVLKSAKAVLDEHAISHKFVIAHHPETGHVHVHAMVNAVSETGERLNFRKADLLKWRETYAEKMRENGVEMVANQRMDLSATRPYTMGQAGAVARSRADSSYAVDPRIIARVDAKGAQLIDPATAASNGKAIAARWQETAIVLRGIDAPAVAAQRAEEFADVLQSVEQQERAGISSARGQTSPTKPSQYNQPDKTVKGFMDLPEMKPILKQIGQIQMSKNTLEIHEKMAEVNSSLDTIRETLPPRVQKNFDKYREGLNDQMKDRLAETRIQQQNATSGAETPERKQTDKEAEQKAVMQDTARHVQATPGTSKNRAEANKEKAKIAERQNQNKQRGRGSDHER